MRTEPFLRGEKVHLALLTDDDVGVIAGWYQDEGFLRLLQSETAAPRTQAQLSEYFDKLHRADDAYVFAVGEVGDGRLVGYVELDGIQWNNRTAWMAVAVGDRADWGRGYGREAVSVLLDFAFSELNLRRVQLTVFAYNERAIRLYERLGFVREGTFREFLHRDGRVYDMYLYGLLDREWRARSKGPAPD